MHIDKDVHCMLVTERCEHLSLEHWARSDRFQVLNDKNKGMVVMRLLKQLTIAVSKLH